MKKLCFILPALLLCACSSHAVVQPVAPSLVQETAAPVPVETTVTPVTIELSNSRKLQAVACKDDLDCFTKLTGLCPNGYTGGHPLVAENERRVAIAFECITDEQKAQMAEQKRQQAEEEKAWRAERAAEMQKRQNELNKKTPARKPAK